ncbi:hypothetical protein AMTR_s00007p00220760 [Amborella trichopoda]|uniref:Uncharacterized protein n=1 Tax=Amborella trichopoda TaxID=13333 RepID=W1PEB9_AMBTC|nr:hypothetical protein AMTR_s00007p00220760 [Amborella trichopoda]
MPKLLTWRARRNAFLRERKRIEAIEMQKLRKTAIRRCRNCLTAYREQNPVGGKYMCSYCGHISRRPVLDIPGGGISGGRGLEGMVGSGIISDLVGKTGKIWSEKVGLERPRWGCGNGWDCSENDGWILGRNGGSFLASEEPCLAENSYCGFVIFVCRLLGFFSLILKWLWRKVLRMGSVGEEVSMDGERRSQYRKGETGPNIQESKGEKAKRKAEEKRLARLGKEMLEEEERKQREEVARLVEEQRRLRDDQLEAIKARERASAMEREREVRREREAEKRRLAKTKDKDKDKGSFNSDGEDIEKRAIKESEKKCEYDKKSDIERRDVTKSTENPRPHGSEMGHGSKGFTGNASKVGGSQYLDRVKGSFLAPSRASSGSTVTSFFKKGFETSTGSSTKVSKHVGSLEYMQNTAINGSPPLHSKKPSSSAWNGMAWTKVWGKGMGFGSDAHPKERKISSSASGDALFCGQRMGNSISDGDYKNAETVRLPHASNFLGMESYMGICKCTNRASIEWEIITRGSFPSPSLFGESTADRPL